jgi:hypothetical protein
MFTNPDELADFQEVEDLQPGMQGNLAEGEQKGHKQTQDMTILLIQCGLSIKQRFNNGDSKKICILCILTARPMETNFA